jgi:hypothetical protein
MLEHGGAQEERNQKDVREMDIPSLVVAPAIRMCETVATAPGATDEP